MKIQKIVVIGAGTMGSGIAQWFTQQDCLVELVDQSTDQLQKAKDQIHSSWDNLVQKNKMKSDAAQVFKTHLHFLQLEETSKDADLVIEAIIENLEIKKNLFKSLDSLFQEKTIIASNTSSFPITLLSKDLSLERQKRFVGLHFFNPATIMKLVEIIKGDATDATLCHDLYSWFESKDKKPALSKDSSGFIVNRVARNFYGEPLRIAKVDDEKRMREIDYILKEVGGFKMGPFELMDLIGIDINYSVTCSVWEAYNKEPRFAPHALQKQMVDEKRLGRKTKRGFYKYD